MRVSAAAKVQWRASRRKMGEFLESRAQLTGQKNLTRRGLRRVTSIWLFATSVRLCTEQVFVPVELEAKAAAG